MATNKLSKGGAAGGPGSRSLTPKVTTYFGGQPSNNTSPRGVSQIGSSMGNHPQVCALLPSLDRGRVAGCRWTLSLTLFAHDEGLGGQKKAPGSAPGLTVWGHHGRVSPWGQKPIR
jgi:hypothetical protein